MCELLPVTTGRNGRNETESSHTMWAVTDIKPSGIDIDLDLYVI